MSNIGNAGAAFTNQSKGQLPSGFSLGLPKELVPIYQSAFKENKTANDPNFVNRTQNKMTVAGLANIIMTTRSGENNQPALLNWVKQQYGNYNGKKWPTTEAGIRNVLTNLINATVLHNQQTGNQSPMFTNQANGAVGVLQGFGSQWANGAGGVNAGINPNTGQIYYMNPSNGQQQNYDPIAQAGLTAKISSIWSADQRVDGLLDQWGFNDIDKGATSRLSQHIYDETIGKGVMLSPNQLANMVQEYKDPQLGKPIYDVVFDGLKDAKAKGYKMNESEYLNFKSRAMEMASAAGISTGDKGFMSSKEIGELVRNGVALPELSERINNAYGAMKNADPRVKETLQKYYGITEGQLLQYYLHPEKGTHHMTNMDTIEKQVASAQIGGFAKNVGLQGLSQGTAEQMAGMLKGQHLGTNNTGPYTMNQVNNAELTAARQGALTERGNGLQAPGSRVNTDLLLAAQIGGAGGINQVQAQKAVQTAEQAKMAPFQKGGGYEESAQGVSGAGSARQ